MSRENKAARRLVVPVRSSSGVMTIVTNKS